MFACPSIVGAPKPFANLRYEVGNISKEHKRSDNPDGGTPSDP
jgi:hypothetical protein